MKVPLDLVLVWFWWFGGAGSGEQEVGYGGGSSGIGIFLDFLSVLVVSECGSCELPRLDLDERLEVLGFEFGSVMRR